MRHPRQIRAPVEEADSLQSFLLLHSLGGGTGSGVGTYILGCAPVRSFAPAAHSTLALLLLQG